MWYVPLHRSNKIKSEKIRNLQCCLILGLIVLSFVACSDDSSTGSIGHSTECMNTYGVNMVAIGTQAWMTENLDYAVEAVGITSAHRRWF